MRDPPSIPANATTRASFYVPVNEDWAIIIDGKAEDMLRRADLEQFIDPGCTTYIELGNDGFEYGCDGGS